MKKLLRFCAVLLLLAFFGCHKDVIEKESDAPPPPEVSVRTKSVSDPHAEPADILILGDKLENPYSVANMQKAYEELLTNTPVSYSSSEIVSIQTTDLYVRFLPKTQGQFKALLSDIKLELFDYPLDYMIYQEGEYYHDPTIPEGDITWQYTTVKPDFDFPDSIQYEIIEECFIPVYSEEEEDTSARAASFNAGADIFLMQLENTALTMTGAIEDLGLGDQEEPQTYASWGWRRPRGKITAYDDCLNVQVPVKGVKVRCHLFVKWSTTFTNEDGDYAMDSKFLFGPHYALVFDNSKGFEVYGNWGPLARANYTMGFRSKNGHSRDIQKSSKSWDYCMVNNAGYEYYQMCEQTGISKPPSDLHVWVFRYSTDTSSAPMLKSIGVSNAIIAFFNAFDILENVMPFIRTITPDVTIGCSGLNSRGIYKIINHEFAHASHYAKVGRGYWLHYINYIVDNKLHDRERYGWKELRHSGYCGVGEMWGYAIGFIQSYEKYNSNELKDSNNAVLSYPGQTVYWFKPEVVWDLYAKGILTKKEIYDCLDSNINSIENFGWELVQRYANRKNHILSVLKEHHPNEFNSATINIPGNWFLNKLSMSNIPAILDQLEGVPLHISAVNTFPKKYLTEDYGFRLYNLGNNWVKQKWGIKKVQGNYIINNLNEIGQRYLTYIKDNRKHDNLFGVNLKLAEYIKGDLKEHRWVLSGMRGHIIPEGHPYMSLSYGVDLKWAILDCQAAPYKSSGEYLWDIEPIELLRINDVGFSLKDEKQEDGYLNKISVSDSISTTSGVDVKIATNYGNQPIIIIIELNMSNKEIVCFSSPYHFKKSISLNYRITPRLPVIDENGLSLKYTVACHPSVIWNWADTSYSIVRTVKERVVIPPGKTVTFKIRYKHYSAQLYYMIKAEDGKTNRSYYDSGIWRGELDGNHKMCCFMDNVEYTVNELNAISN